MTGLALFGAWLALCSLIAFVQFGLDKTRARSGGRRVSEATLLWTALVGGAVGAKLGQGVFRHKTVKQPFGRLLNAAFAVNLVAGLGAFAPGFG